uniref:hypothetical protein n=1 Tax=Bacillus multifaciens TaxID=3068506 RepID=UPI003F49AC81
MTFSSHPKKRVKLSRIKAFTRFLEMLSIITIIKRLKVPQGTGSIFEQITLKNLHLHNKKSKGISLYFFYYVLAKLFSAGF